MNRLVLRDYSSLEAFDGLATPVWVFDVDNHCMWWGNLPALKFWEADSVVDLVARDFSTDGHTTRERLRQIVDVKQSSASIQETWTLYPKGTPRTVFLTFQPVIIEDDTNGVLIEIHHAMEQGEDADSWRILEAARATSLLVSMFSLDGKLLAQNPAAAACYGRQTEGEATERDFQERFSDPAVARHVLATVSRGEHLSWEVETQTSDGQRTHLISASKGRDPISGDFVAILSEEDVTEMAAFRRLQQTAHEELRGAMAERSARLSVVEESYALVMETALIWDWDLTTDSVFFSPGFVEALGYQEEEFRDIVNGRALLKLIDPGHRTPLLSELRNHLSDPDSTLSLQTCLIGKFGKTFWFHAQGRCLRDDLGRPVRSLGILTDVSQQKELEDTLMASQRLEAIGQLTGGIAHDFNNLLSVILGNAELLEMSGQAEPELTQEISQAVKRGAELTGHLLSFSRKQTLLPKRVDIRELIGRMSKTLLRTLGEEIDVEVRMPPDLWRVYADPNRIEAALLNVALNARDAMPKGGSLVITCKNRRLRTASLYKDYMLNPGQFVEITVTDSGHGMPQQVMSKVFEPFYTTKGVGEGSGLGLSMVLGFSRQSGGDARIFSEEGKGTSVSLFLPRARDLSDPKEMAKALAEETSSIGHVHVLEDNPHVQRMLVRMVEALGFRVTTSSDGDAALRAALTKPYPDLLLLDIILPGGKSGLDVAQAVLFERPEARLILMSGYPDTEFEKNGDEEQSWRFLMKPIERDALKAALQEMLGVAL